MGEKDPGTPCHADHKLNTAEREQKIEIEIGLSRGTTFSRPPHEGVVEQHGQRSE